MSGERTWGDARDELGERLKALVAVHSALGSLLPDTYQGRTARTLLKQAEAHVSTARAIVKEDLKVKVTRRGERVFGPLTPEQEAQVIHLHADRLNDAQIALELGTSAGNVSKVIREATTGERRPYWPTTLEGMQRDHSFCRCIYHRKRATRG